MQSVEATAYENGETIAALSDDGVAVFPADDAMCADLAAAVRYTSRHRFRARSLCRRYSDISTGRRRRADFDGDALWSDRRATRCRWRAQRSQRIGCCGVCDCGRYRRGRDRRRLERLAAGCGAGCEVANQGLRRDRRYATTQIRIRSAPRSICSLQRRRRACWCWATWAKWECAGPEFHREVGPMRTSAASMRSSRSGR